MPTNLIFMGLHFVIGKRMFRCLSQQQQKIEMDIYLHTVYANSLLVTQVEPTLISERF